MNNPRLIQTYLPDGTLEGVRVIELSESSIKAFVVPRIKVNHIKDRKELKQPALYLLINSGDNQIYIGESENFFHRIKNHDQSKDFWDTAVAIVSSANTLGKTDVKYLESLAVEKAQATAAMEVLNKTIPARNNIHEFKIHSMETILEDIALVAESIGFSIFSSRSDQEETIWHAKSKKTLAKAQFRGDKFVVLAGSMIDNSVAPSWRQRRPERLTERNRLLTKHGTPQSDITLLNDNVSFKSPNLAGHFVTGRSINAWTTWKNSSGQSMDEVMRKGER
ncbi:TPA: GIY-YIG nuclease family protein [Candidatus Saccharibacteria bacterium]|nr:GIY-YIG nuclease family protein [Candidatus Saccharibacteria bacterium]HIO87316.1 GIY-YIG nuclease family protein [Candidatus Saccharibacteria bacterium]